MNNESKRHSASVGPLGDRFEAALVLMVALHGSDVRKTTGVPYIGHLLGVCGLVLSDGGSEDEAIAALLHDALEEHPDKLARTELGDRFNVDVLRLVKVCTDTPIDYVGGAKPPWRERKRVHIEKIAATDPSLLRVPLADKVDNVRALIGTYREVGDAIWQKFNAGRDDQLWYYRSLATAFRQAGVTSALLDEYGRIVNTLEELTRQ